MPSWHCQPKNEQGCRPYGSASCNAKVRLVIVSCVACIFELPSVGFGCMAGDEIVAGDDIYGGTDRLLTRVVPKGGVTVR